MKTVTITGGERLDFLPTGVKLGVFVTFQHLDGEWHWKMRRELAEALEELRWVDRHGAV